MTTANPPVPALRPGSPYVLGATPEEGGTNFALVAEFADGVELCLFDESGAETRLPLLDVDAGVWHGFVAGVGPGQAYGYRTTGPYDPANGMRHNPAKLLIDPYARAIAGQVRFGPEVMGYAEDDPESPSSLDSSGFVPRSLVVDPTFAWSDRRRPNHRYADTIFYEVHVKGFTMNHPEIPPELRGTYAGLGHEAAIAHLTDLGVTAVELLPVHHSVPESFLLDRGLTNYWGYNTIGYFAPHESYSAAVRAGRPGGQVAEFKAMVDSLHGAGLEVVLDVVFNHTAEANDLGPTLCFRGLDNPAYYRLVEGDLRHYVDTTGCGNTLNAGDPVSLRLIMDSLRYWLTEMRVDGFRFDLAPALGRQDGRFEKVSAFFDMVAQDPVISRAKLVAEPWDVGQGDSYELGQFPPLWREWNGKYRDSMRDFWRSHPGLIGEFASRFTGSSDLFADHGRRPTSSVNLITVHDGFTLADLVSYDSKHNEANGEDNRDGTDDNRSWNCGAEGPTEDPDIVALRARQRARHARHPAPLLRGAAPPGRRRTRAQPTGQQQRLLPGQSDHLVRLDPGRHRAAGLHPAVGVVSKGPPGLPTPPVPGRNGGLRTGLVHAQRHGHDRGRLGRHGCARRGPLPRWLRRPRPRRGRRPPGRRRLPGPGQRLVGTARVHRSAHPSRPELVRRARHVRDRGQTVPRPTGGRWHHHAGPAVHRRAARAPWGVRGPRVRGPR